ncbi:MAG: arginine--tRNA ligase [Patescibacteria group bacterium]
MIRQEIKNLIEKAIKKLQKDRIFPVFEIPEIKIESVENRIGKQLCGDYSSAIAIRIRRDANMNPMEVAEKIKLEIGKANLELFWKIEPAKPGFINFFLSENYLQKQVGEILKQKNKFGELKIGNGRKVNVEFISANPTGPLTLGNGRGGFCGDVLANILAKAGYKVSREYYVNDIGEQVRKLGHSVLGDAEAVYRGPYIEDLKTRFNGGSADEAEKLGEKAASVILEEMIKPSVEKMGIKFDTWFSEKSLHEKKKINKISEFLKKKNLAYEQEGALWFRSAQFGDDKDRVLIKADGETTYLASDVAYLKDKFGRGFDELIFFWGADHYGYINRLKAAAVAFGYKKEQLGIIIMQLVRLMEAGKEVRMSKRTGIYVTIDELIDEVGLDAARFFFLARGADSHLNFDLNLAKEQSEKNPVYYVQYAHARICSILTKIPPACNALRSNADRDLKTLNHPSELNLIKQLIELPEALEDTAKDYQIQRLPQYATDLATAFHQFYRDCRVINENGSANEPRLALVLAAKIVLENTLKLMGISAPEKM